ncbi:C-C motif chemokine 28-like [Latimeria chalumnae]|uniref:C-C motif chemokine 28-like n=1 Tax=Latimeria chalumnae TaxID=7897 RepID=UPI0003C19C6C|nr:PREDICTED: C-C motif chemokine 28-like [Latimeria chalumnae]|eukprot:XP_005999084.1 PREDICTED: C-C motif chemokine 28-like [Latimeria chalumnae]
MELKVAALFTVVATVVVNLSEGMPKCCTETSSNISKRLLEKVKTFKIQKQDGVCDIEAVVLYVANRELCADPRNKLLKDWIKQRKSNSSSSSSKTPSWRCSIRPQTKNKKQKKRACKKVSKGGTKLKG